jgi:hypothetical protein
MSQETTYSGKLGDWQRLLDPLLTNATELPHLETHRNQLAAVIAQVTGLAREQSSRKAAKQTVSQQLSGAVKDGERLVTLLRQAVKVHYGIRSEKLTEFGVQPFRGRPRKKVAAPSPELPASAASS